MNPTVFMISEFSNEQVNELRKLLQDEFGLDVSIEEASQYGMQFIELLRTVYKETSNHSDSSPP